MFNLNVKASSHVQPCRGVSLHRHPVNDFHFLRVHYSARPDLTNEYISSLRSQYASDAIWEREMEMNPRAAQGSLVFPEYDPKKHLVSRDQLPSRGCVYMAIDPHPRTPHAFLWLVVDRYGDYYIYREYWPSIVYGLMRKIRDDERENVHITIWDYVRMVARLEGNDIAAEYESAVDLSTGYVPKGLADNVASGEYMEKPGGERIMVRLMDQAGKAFSATGESARKHETYHKRYRRFGLVCHDPKKSHEAGIDAIREALKPRRHDLHGDWPQLHIWEGCRETDGELRNFKYADSSDSLERDQNQKVSEFRTHMVDLLRYLLVRRPTYDARYECSIIPGAGRALGGL